MGAVLSKATFLKSGAGLFERIKT